MSTYSFLDVIATITGPGGLFQIGGDGAANTDEGITCERADQNTMAIGADGNPMHSLHADRSGTATVRLQKTSPINALLSAMFALQEQSSTLWGINTIVVTNIATGDVYTCTVVAFKKFPSNTYAKDAGMLEWNFDVGIMDPLLGIGIPNLGG